MAPTPLKKLIALQSSRMTELQSTSTRLTQRNRDTLNAGIIASRLERLKQIWDDARVTHAEIVTRDVPDTDPYVADDIYNKMLSCYEDTIDFLLTAQAEIEEANRPARRAGTRRRRSNSNSDDEESCDAKLPRVDLPKFSGKYEDWDNFCDLFTTLVHNQPRISNATKLSYLKTCLQDAAADSVKDVSTSNANYQSTWEALKARYHNPRIVVNNHLSALRDLPSIKKESAAELRSFTDSALHLVRALKNLKMPVDHWDVWFVFHLASKLDPESRKLWEAEQSAKDRRVLRDSDPTSLESDPLQRFPTFAELSEFLIQRTQSLGVIAADQNKTDNKQPSAFKHPSNSRKVLHASSTFPSEGENRNCPLCTGRHPLHRCLKFKSKSSQERRREVLRLKLCFNCFRKHAVRECPSTFVCNLCGKKHHTLIHSANPQSTGPGDTPVDQSKQESGGVKVHTASIAPAHETHSVILATAQMMLEGPRGARTQVRALLDQGSETSFVTDKIANLLDLEKHRVSVPLSGLGSSAAGTARSATRLMLQSLVDPSFTFETDALILPKLTSRLPSRELMNLSLEMFANITLADPHFYVPDSIDVILGADIYGQLLRSGLRKFPSLSLTAQNTALGWIVSGPVKISNLRRAATSPKATLQALHCSTECNLDESLQRFWNLEELPPVIKTLNPQEDACEKLFRETHSRDASGRFVVRLPLKSDPPLASRETLRMATSSLAHMHRRFTRDTRLAAEYQQFMDIYEKLGHMERVPESEIDNPRAWYLPHHAIVQSTPTKWKLRVVFDASRKTHDKICLNDFLLPGEPLQRDLFLVLLNWRWFRFVFSADQVKMFRQIRIAPEQQDFQRVVWAPTPRVKPVVLRLTTVTYGTTCAPHLALRTLKQLAKDERVRFPLGAKCLEEDTYVDDTFAGADELDQAVKIQRELIAILGTAGFELDKWSANHPDLLPSRDAHLGSGESKTISSDETVKTLGVQWNPTLDEFRFTTVDFKGLAGALTKRSVLSNVARLFDPLGWLSPVTVTAKILMQDLWISKCGWDAPLPSEIRERWLNYCESLSSLSDLSINRWLGSSTGITAQIHGFSDASSRAYAAAVYIRIREPDGGFRVTLLAAKSKVAPVKTVSIPNLELCGAVLLVKLLLQVRKLECFKDLPVFAWSDSQIVLTWLRKHPCSWKVFVANRVSFIQTELPSAVWAHVPTKENPADLATRGCTPFDLIHTNLWWYGPEWLRKSEEHWPQPAIAPQVLFTKRTPSEPEILTRFSSLTRLTRVVAYCRRPLTNLRRRKNNDTALPDFLTASELAEARAAVIRLAQTHAFAKEIKLLQEGKSLPKRHPLLALNPIFDEQDGILRVGGRLENADLPWNQRHPPILPHHSALSRLFVRYAHQACLHGGPTLTSATVMQHVWILGRNRLAKTEVHKCMKCQRVKPRTAQQMMGALPAHRVNQARPFSAAGVDYAGPIQIRTTKGRGHKSYKGYIALFICFSTRAIHLEAVSDLTAQTFLAAFKRFTSRRGLCANLYSDNATNFQAADKELKSMFKAASDFYKTAAASLANDGTSWTFIPPNSPHYGGLWEAGVKSVKHHLKRAIGERTLTFEEFATVLAEIEACLNSRPLAPLKNDVDDLGALTPSHFLIDGPSVLIPDSAPPDVPESRLERFHRLQVIRNNFWNRWSKEYRYYLQERSKWRTPAENFAVGQLVLVRDDRYPPSKWPLGRVIEIHLGDDGLVRVVTLRTATSILRRHIARLCPLVIEQNQEKPDT